MCYTRLSGHAVILSCHWVLVYAGKLTNFRNLPVVWSGSRLPPIPSPITDTVRVGVDPENMPQGGRRKVIKRSTAVVIAVVRRHAQVCVHVLFKESLPCRLFLLIALIRVVGASLHVTSQDENSVIAAVDAVPAL